MGRTPLVRAGPPDPAVLALTPPVAFHFAQPRITIQSPPTSSLMRFRRDEGASKVNCASGYTERDLEVQNEDSG